MISLMVKLLFYNMFKSFKLPWSMPSRTRGFRPDEKGHANGVRIVRFFSKRSLRIIISIGCEVEPVSFSKRVRKM